MLMEKDQLVAAPGTLGVPLGATNAAIIAKDVPMKESPHPLNKKEQLAEREYEFSYRKIAMPKW